MSACEHCGQQHPAASRFCPATGKLIPERLLAPGTVLERKYRIGRPLGAGGMGAVFEATHDLLGHKVAIKVLLPELSRDAEMSSRLIREGRAASATGHRNIAAVTDMGHTEEGSLFIVMEFLDGRTLDEVVDEVGELTVQRAAALICQVLEGLEAVHGASIIHRDLKPENVMVVERDGREVAKVLDFGISKMEEKSKQELTATGLVFGTPAYMAPEQTKGAATVDHRADLYSTGAMLFKLLTGSPPVVAPTLAGLLARLVQGDIDPPSSLRDGISAALDRVVMRSLATDPVGRFADARSFRRALSPFVDGSATEPELFTDEHQFDDDSLVHLDELGPAGGRQAPAAKGPAAPPAAPRPRRATDPPSAATSPRAEDPAGPMAGAGNLANDEAFRPPDEKGPQEADLSPAPAASQPAMPSVTESQDRAPVHRGSARRSSGAPPLLWGLLALVVVVGIGWYLWPAEKAPAAPPAPSVVRITLETSPEKVDIVVDGVLQVGQPIKLPRSAQTFNIRVEAKGYRAQTLQLVADRDQHLKVELKRAQ